MINFTKHSAAHVLLDTSEFSAGSGILDVNSLNAQKAFKDINDRLLLATETYDGLLSSADKTKLNNFQYDVLDKVDFTATAGQSVFDTAKPIVKATVFVEGLLLDSTSYFFNENESTFTIIGGVDEDTKVTIYFTNGIVVTNVIDDTSSSNITTYSSEKIDTLVGAAGSVLKYESVLVVSDTITVAFDVKEVVSLYVIDLGELTLSSVSDITDKKITLSDSTLDGETIEIAYNA